MIRDVARVSTVLAVMWFTMVETIRIMAALQGGGS